MGEASIPDISFTFRPSETDAAQLPGFPTPPDFEPGHFDEPDYELQGELMMLNPFPPAHDEGSGSSILSNQPPTHDDIQARLESLGEELQALVLNDAARRLEIDELRQAGQAHTSRLDTHDLSLKDLQAMYANLAQDHNHTKTQLAEALTQFSDLIRYISNAHQSSAAGISRTAASTSHSAAVNLMDFFTNTPQPSINALPPAHMHRPAFDSASHSGRPIHPLPNRPVTRRTASSMLPQGEAAASTTCANRPRAASAMTKAVDSSLKGKGRGRGKEKSRGKGKGKEKERGKGRWKGKGRAVDDVDIEDDKDEDIEDDEDEDIEDADEDE